MIAAPVVHVVISTYAPRLEWCRELLTDIEAQTLPPEHVHVLYDPPHEGLVPREHELALTWTFNRERVGPAERWRFISREYDAESNVIVVALDDDIRIGPRYLELCARWCQMAGAAISWWPLDEAEIKNHAPGVRIPILAGGLTTVRAKWLHGIERAPYADKFLAWEACDDAFLSWFLWWRGISIVRPTNWAGNLALRTVPDEESRGPIYGPRLRAQLEELRATGWRTDAPLIRLDRERTWPK